MSSFLIDFILFRKLIGHYSLKVFFIFVLMFFTIDFFVYIVLNFYNYAEIEVKVLYLFGIIIIYRFFIESFIVNFNVYSTYYNIVLKFMSKAKVGQAIKQKEEIAWRNLLKRPLTFFKFDNFYISWLLSAFFLITVLSVIFQNSSVVDSYIFDIGFMHIFEHLPESIKKTSFFYFINIFLFLFSLRIYLEVLVLSIRQLQIINIIMECLIKQSVGE